MPAGGCASTRSSRAGASGVLADIGRSEQPLEEAPAPPTVTLHPKTASVGGRASRSPYVCPMTWSLSWTAWSLPVLPPAEPTSSPARFSANATEPMPGTFASSSSRARMPTLPPWSPRRLVNPSTSNEGHLPRPHGQASPCPGPHEADGPFSDVLRHRRAPHRSGAGPCHGGRRRSGQRPGPAQRRVVSCRATSPPSWRLC